jgi:hypothetical protein
MRTGFTGKSAARASHASSAPTHNIDGISRKFAFIVVFLKSFTSFQIAAGGRYCIRRRSTIREAVARGQLFD